MNNDNWNYWTDRSYYHKELKERAEGLKEEMEAAKHISELIEEKAIIYDKILDVGCGTGHFILSLEKRLQLPFSYHGIDITRQHIIDANQIFSENEKYSFEQGDIRDLKVEDNSFDVSICSNTIPHIPNIDIAINELIRVTKKDVFVRMLVGNETLISKKALSDDFDENGEPLSYMYVNIYKEDYIRKLFGSKGTIHIYDDVFDKERIMEHYKAHSAVAGNNIATRIIDNTQFKGHLMLPWKVVHIKLS